MRYHGSEEITVQVVIQPGAAHIFEHSLHYAVYPAGVFAHVFTAIFLRYRSSTESSEDFLCS